MAATRAHTRTGGVCVAGRPIPGLSAIDPHASSPSSASSNPSSFAVTGDSSPPLVLGVPSTRTSQSSSSSSRASSLAIDDVTARRPSLGVVTGDDSASHARFRALARVARRVVGIRARRCPGLVSFPRFSTPRAVAMRSSSSRTLEREDE
jgi:hypothetical protein